MKGSCVGRVNAVLTRPKTEAKGVRRLLLMTTVGCADIVTSTTKISGCVPTSTLDLSPDVLPVA